MCEQCTTKSIAYSTPIIDGFYVFKAMQDGNIMEEGDYGIVQMNDPDFIFQLTDMNKYDPDTIENDSDDDSDDGWRSVLDFAQSFWVNPEKYYSAYSAYEFFKSYREAFNIPESYTKTQMFAHVRNTIIDVINNGVLDGVID